MTPAEHGALQLLNRAVRPIALHNGPIPAQMASDTLADISAAVLCLGRPISMATLDAITELVRIFQGEITG